MTDQLFDLIVRILSSRRSRCLNETKLQSRVWLHFNYHPDIKEQYRTIRTQKLFDKLLSVKKINHRDGYSYTYWILKPSWFKHWRKEK
jgi:hypothetical protein